ncbi:MAG: rRNA maturation RNase YbeY [Patescibacteria group bacterium]
MNKVIVSALNPKFKKLERPLKRAVLFLLKHHPYLKNKTVEICLVDSKTINKNVLAFPAPKNFLRPDLKGLKSLGEIYLNPDYIQKHRENLEFMLIHGFLHLLGYDHKKNSDTMIMQKKELRLMELVVRK